MPTTQELRERRANVWSQMKEVIDLAEREGRDLSAEERAKYDNAEKDLDKLGEDINLREKHEEREREFSQVDRRELVPARGRGRGEGAGAAAKAYEDVFTAVRAPRRRPTQRAADPATLETGIADIGDEARALGIGTNTAGGYTVPAGFRDELIRTTKTYGGMLDNATVLQTDSGQSLPWPTVNDTGNVGAILAENTQLSQQDVVFGTATLGAYMYTSKLVLVSYQLLNDSAIDVDGTLRSLLAERIGRIWNTHFTTGTGTSQPTGLVTGATTGVTGTTGQTTSVIYDNLVDLIHSIDPSYRNANCKFMVADATLAAVRKLKDTQGHPLWQPSVQAGTPDTLLAYPVVINQDMPVMAANAKSILFGDIRSAYVARIVNDVQIVRLNERYADFLQVGFFGFARADGTVQNANAIRVYANSAT
jgi:HK97 family phage major capsid protein